MNHGLAVDASVAVKRAVLEPFTNRALKLWAGSLAADRPVVAPPHFPGEVANALYQRLRSADPARQVSRLEAEEALTQILQYPVEIVAPPDLTTQAFAFAHQHGLPSLYDSLYVVQAQLLNVELWSADQRLLGSLGASARWVRFVGDYPLS